MTTQTLVHDPLSGSDMTQEELDYLNEFRLALSSGQLKGQPQNDGSWEIGIGQEGDPMGDLSQRPEQFAAGVQENTAEFFPLTMPRVAAPYDYEPIVAERLRQKRNSTTNQPPTEFDRAKLERMAEDVEAQAMPFTAEQTAEQTRLLRAQALRDTGEDDPDIQSAIYTALSDIDLGERDLTTRFKQEVLYHYRDGRAGAFEGRLAALDRQESWTRAIGLARDGVLGPIISEQLTAQITQIALAPLDPISTAGRLILGEERWEALPDPVKTAAEWAPILLAPQKGILKDFLVGGMGVRGGVVAIGGAVAGEQLAQELGAPEFPIEFAGAVVAGGLAAIGRNVAQRTIQPVTWAQMSDRFKFVLAGERGALDLGKLGGPQGKPLAHIWAEIEDMKARMQPEVRAKYDHITSLIDAMPEADFAPVGIAREAETAGNRLVFRRIRNYDEGIAILEAMKGVNNIETLRAQGQLELTLDIPPVSLADGFQSASSIDGHAVTTKFPAIERAKKAGATPIFTSPFPTVANLYAGGANLLVAIEFEPTGLIYESSRVARTRGAAYSATFADAEQVIDAKSIKRVRVVTPQSVERLNEFDEFFNSQMRAGYFKGAWRDKDPELVAANVVASQNLEAPIYHLDRIFKEVPLRLTNGLSVMEGSRIRLWNGTEAVMSPATTQPFMWNGRIDMEQLAERRAHDGGIQMSVKAIKGEIPTPEGWNYWPQGYIRDDMIAEVWDRKSRRWVSAIEAEPQTDFVQNAKQAVRNFLKDERGSFQFRPPEDQLDPAVAKLLGIEPGIPEIKGERPEPKFLAKVLTHYPSGKSTRYGPFGVFKRLVTNEPDEYWITMLGGKARKFGTAEEAADFISKNADFAERTPAGFTDVTAVLEGEAATLAAMPEDELRTSYLEASKEAYRAQDLMDAISAGESDFSSEIAHGNMLRALAKVQTLGEELAIRTGGKEGVAPKIKRLFDQFIAEEEGAIRISLPTGVDPSQRKVTFRPTPHTVRLLDVRPIDPHLTPREKLFNIMKNTLHLGTPADPLASRMVDEYSRIRGTTLENQANRAAAIAESIQHRYFKPDVDGRLQDIRDAPTMQDLAAKFANYKPLLRTDQIAAVERLRALLEPYTAALTEQEIALRTRGDIEPGGFYLPRGHAEEDALDYRSFGLTPPTRRGVTRSFEREAIFDTMVQGIEGVQIGGKLVQYGYHDFGTTMQVYFRDAGQRVLDAHMANILKNATDASGIPLASTAHGRLLRQNPKLAARMEGLRKQTASIANSIELLDKRIHGVLLTFVHSPAPDLDALRIALNKLQTKGGRLRVRMTEQERQQAFRELRKEINEAVFRNRGRYKGMTGEQARKAALKDALDRIRIRRGRFKGLSFEDGQAQLNALKSTIAGLDTDWQAALDRARRLPSGEMSLEVRGFGVGLQGTAFDEGLASVFNNYLRNIGPPSGVRAEAFLVWEATNTLLRGVRATADVSWMAIQGLLGAVHEPNSYRRAAAGAFRSVLDPTNGKFVLGRFLDDFDRAAVKNGMPTSFEWSAAGLRMGGIDTEFMIGGKLGQGIGGLPVVKQANRSFGYFGDILRFDGAQSQFEIKGLANLMPSQRMAAMKEIAMAQNLMTGWSPGRFLGDTGNLLMFAPRFLQSQLELVVRAMPGLPGSGQNLTRDQTRRMLLKLVGTGVTMTVLANEALGNEDFDYYTPIINSRFNPNLMRIRAAGQDISLFGPWDSLVRAMVMAVQGDPFYMARSKASPTIAVAWDIISGETFLGDRAPQIANLAKDVIGEARAFATGTDYEPTGDWSLVPEYFLRAVLPFSISDIGEKPLISTLIGTTGAKAMPLSNTEKRDVLINKVKGELVESETVPADMADAFKRTPYHAMPSSWRKLIDRQIRENYPNDEASYREARRQDTNIYQTVGDIADFERERYKGDYDKLFEMLLLGEPPDVVWEGFDDSRNKLAGALTAVYEGKSKEAQEFQKAIATLRPSDLRLVEAAYNGIIAKHQRGPNIFDWDAIDRARIDFLVGLQASDPEVARQFVFHLGLKELLDLEDAHPLIQLKKLTNQQLQPYYALLDRDASSNEKVAWLNTNPDADFGMWLTATWESPTVHSVDAAAKALTIPNRIVKLTNSTLEINRQNLPTLQKYDKEITRLLTLPGEARDAAGRSYSPRTRLREADPLYDALYFWLGLSKGDANNTAVVYHLGAVQQYLQQWGPRSDSVKPRLSR